MSTPNQSSGSRPAPATAANTAQHLARVRENQRRSRARRKEYLHDLEEKFRKCRDKGVEASAEMQQAARRVLEENQRLRMALRAKGMPDHEIDDLALSPASTGPVAELGSMLQRPKPCSDEGSCGRDSTSPDILPSNATFPRSSDGGPSTADSETKSDASPSPRLPSSSLAPSDPRGRLADQHISQPYQLPTGEYQYYSPALLPLPRPSDENGPSLHPAAYGVFPTPSGAAGPASLTARDRVGSAGFSAHDSSQYMLHPTASPALSGVDMSDLLSPELQAHFTEALQSGEPQPGPGVHGISSADPEWVYQEKW